MESVEKLKYLVASYLALLFFLLLCVAATPLVVRHGIAMTRRFIIEEGTVETTLIVILFAVSYLIWRGFNHALKAYGRAANRAGEDKSRLVSRLAEAFNYIGTVNVEIQEIQSILCGVERYPHTRKEFRLLLHRLTSKAMQVAGTPWIVLRMIDGCRGRTIGEQAIERRSGMLPSVTMGNRAILEGRHVEGVRTIGLRRKHLDLLTVCILPQVPLSEEQIVLITAITNQIEMLFMVYRAGRAASTRMLPAQHAKE